MAVIKSGSPIDLEYARKLVDTYQTNKLGNVLGNDETRAVWFSKELILQALGAPADAGSDEITGLRIYFGSYADNDEYPPNSYDKNKLTLVLVQTGVESIEIDRGTVVEKAYLDIINDPGAQPSYPSGVPSIVVKTCFNDGQINPPPDGAKGLGLMDW